MKRAPSERRKRRRGTEEKQEGRREVKKGKHQKEMEIYSGIAAAAENNIGGISAM